ncbi:MAG: hypothetical protein JW908_10125 [Anaerolineales bacterium]|nr:hypothetical protein [Anaerolineales bacterium]
MRRTQRKYPWLINIFCIFVFLLLTGCDPITQTATATSTEIVLPPTATSTIAPSETPQPPWVVLLAPSGADAALIEDLQILLEDRAAQAGFRFEVVQTLSPDDFFTQDIKVVFVLPPDPGVSILAAAAKQTQFVAIGVAGLQASGNINLIASSSSRPDKAGFLAGVVAAVTTDDFRVGVIYPAETAVGKAARRGFSNGVTYFCGFCQPVHPPYPASNYPLFYELPVPASEMDWDAAIEYFNIWQAKTIYITPDLDDLQLGNYLAQAGFRIISQSKPGEDIKDKWTASIGAGDVVQIIDTHWQEFLSGDGGLSIEFPLGITNVNENVISPGKLQYIDIVISDLKDDFIDTGVDPTTGEWR